MDQFIDNVNSTPACNQSRNGPFTRVLIVTRISTKNQDIRACADSQAYCERWLKENIQGELQIRSISSQGSGECLARPELRQLEDIVEDKAVDIVLCEESSRISRRNYIITFCELCEDHDVRFIAINDNIDTAEDWRLNTFFASMKHEMSNKDTSNRIRRSLRNRFTQGGIVQYVVYGHIKPPGAKSDIDLRLDQEAIKNIDRFFTDLEQGATYSDVADWLNQIKAPVGKHCRLQQWTPGMVTRLVHNPILKGLRVRNSKMSKRINKTGVRKSIKAPRSERLERFCPHLVIIEPDRYDRVLRILDARNGGCCRTKINGTDPRANVPKKRSDWPGSHLRCGVCGRIFRYGAHGMENRLFCAGAYEYRCWNAVSVNGPLAAEKILSAILLEISKLPDFDAAFLRQVEAEWQQKLATNDTRRRDAQALQSQLQRAQQNLLDVLKEMGSNASVESELLKVEQRMVDNREELRSLDEESGFVPQLPNACHLRELAEEALKDLPRKSAVFATLMRKWMPSIFILPVQRWDGGKASPRAFLDLELVNLLPASQHYSDIASRLHRRLVVDLFDPATLVSIRERVVEAVKNGQKQREIAEDVQSHQATVQRALRLHAFMQDNNTTDPYRILTKPPSADEDAKWRRHRHSRYSFVPLDGFPINPS